MRGGAVLTSLPSLPPAVRYEQGAPAPSSRSPHAPVMVCVCMCVCVCVCVCVYEDSVHKDGYKLS